MRRWNPGREFSLDHADTWSLTFSLQNCEKLISIFKLPHLWHFTMATRADKQRNDFGMNDNFGPSFLFPLLILRVVNPLSPLSLISLTSSRFSFSIFTHWIYSSSVLTCKVWNKHFPFNFNLSSSFHFLYPYPAISKTMSTFYKSVHIQLQT